MFPGFISGNPAGRFASTGAVSSNSTGVKVTTGFAGGGSGSVSPGSRYFANSARVWKNFGVVQPASLMGAS